MQRHSIYARLFDRLDALIPNLSEAQSGDTFVAHPKIPGDMTVYCTVTSVSGGHICLDLAHNQAPEDETMPAPWMAFRVDTTSEVAELMALEDEWRYEVAYSTQDQPNPRRQTMNLFAVNWLTIMHNLQSVFQRGTVAESTCTVQ